MRPIFFLLFLAFLALVPQMAAAQCPQWDVTGRWDIQQSNGFLIHVDMLQRVSGILSGQTTPSNDYKDRATIGGNVAGNDVFFRLVRQGETGIYRGKIGPEGRIDGTTYDKNFPSSQATWFSTSPMRCGKPVAVPVGEAPFPRAVPSSVLATPPPPKKTIKMTGKPRPPANTPATVTQTTTTTAGMAPSIKAVPANGFGLHKTNGTTTLTWDGGKDHPYAEVWVKIDDADETFVVEQGKGTREVTVEPGKTYVYILTDAGKRLSTVTLKYQ